MPCGELETEGIVDTASGTISPIVYSGDPRALEEKKMKNERKYEGKKVITDLKMALCARHPVISHL